MANLKDLIVNGFSRLKKGLKLSNSGVIVEGDHRAVSGEVLSQFINPDAKRCYFTGSGYSHVTVPIIVDETLKRSRTLVIGVMYGSLAHIPGYIQFYDPDNWLSTNDEGIKIYIYNTNNILDNSTTSTEYSLEWKSVVYWGDDRNGGQINIIITTNVDNLDTLDSSKNIILTGAIQKKAFCYEISLGKNKSTGKCEIGSTAAYKSSGMLLLNKWGLIAGGNPVLTK